MQDYWAQHSASGSIEEMMLDNDAGKIEAEERQEILSMLPSVKDKRVLELAAGVGRFTGELCKEAKAVTAVDFVQKFSDMNLEANNRHGNLQCLCADVTVLEQRPRSHDLVFSNWLLMYLSDEEVQRFATNAMLWLKPGGSLFFRESCFRQSGNAARNINPTQYRRPGAYTDIFSAVTAVEDGTKYTFELRRMQPVQTYIKHKGNDGQICWLWTKVALE